MWRAFFFAVGTMLIILGLECLVVERFIVQKARIPAIVAKVLDGASKKAGPELAQANGGGSSASAFGPSRFSDSFSNTSQTASGTPQLGSYYGGVPSSRQSANANSGFSLAGFGQSQDGIAPLAESPFAAGNSGAGAHTRVIQPKDWMPWSLLAAGTLVVLYTNTTTGRGFSGGGE